MQLPPSPRHPCFQHSGVEQMVVAGPGPALLTAPSPFPLQACASSHSLCSNLSSTWSLSEFPAPLGGPEAAGEAAVVGGPEPHTSVRCLP